MRRGKKHHDHTDVAATLRTPHSKPAAGTLYNRSRITNGRDLLPGIDGRGLWARRYRDLIDLHLSDIGGEDFASQAQVSLVRRAAALTVELERLEAKFATNDHAEPNVERHQRATNTLRRTLQALGLERRQRDVTPTIDQIARERAA